MNFSNVQAGNPVNRCHHLYCPGMLASPPSLRFLAALVRSPPGISLFSMAPLSHSYCSLPVDVPFQVSSLPSGAVSKVVSSSTLPCSAFTSLSSPSGAFASHWHLSSLPAFYGASLQDQSEGNLHQTEDSFFAAQEQLISAPQTLLRIPAALRPQCHHRATVR
eukprot:759839-Hanusia_phi.AAC.2